MKVLFPWLCLVLLLSCTPVRQQPAPVSEDPSEAPASEDPVSRDPQPAVLPEILTFSVKEYPQAKVTFSEDYTLTVEVPRGSFRTALTALFTVPEGVTASPASGTVLDFTNPQKIFLSAPDGTARKYVVTVAEAPYTGTTLYQLRCDDTFSRVYVRGSEVSLSVPFGTDLSALHLSAVMSEGATGSPAVADARQPFVYTVTAEDGVSRAEYTVTVTQLPRDKAVRGVYLPDPSHTRSFMSPEGVRTSIALLKELKFNCLYVCAWARSRVAWPSQVLLDNSTYSALSETNLYRSYAGEDALADIIAEAHKAGIRVILWFEYGFMHKAGSVDWNDPVLASHPGWMGLGQDGKPAAYNGNDFYYNAYDPEVRQFLLALMREALDRYPDVDGIQGDDRLPAMPRESGYNPATVASYCEQTGNPVPTDDRDPAWSQWRLDILNGFAGEMAALARSHGKLICFAPNKYPWCESVLMQQWPVWVQSGHADLLNVQLYITDRYDNDLADTVPYAGDVPLSPSMILKNGSALLDRQLIADEFYANRKAGTAGESQFWFDGLLDASVQDTFRRLYPVEAEWPLK